jgi:uncharacterized protein
VYNYYEAARFGFEYCYPSSRRVASFANIRQAIEQSFPGQICQVSLFGSKARGESNPDPDEDVLVIVNQQDWPLRREIIDIASNLSLEYDLLLSPRVISAQRWQTRKSFSLYRNIARDALPISLDWNNSRSPHPLSPLGRGKSVLAFNEKILPALGDKNRPGVVDFAPTPPPCLAGAGPGYRAARRPPGSRPARTRQSPAPDTPRYTSVLIVLAASCGQS